ncbi:FHA domain-containing protein [Microbacterium sp.]|uniref:FHA domain-containing protein n=1 Tax=Microbacterium sp. TaxID=51671 RepID=UPI0025DC3E4B|nr:FHA domain-containing protein [Microbacterium sp.]
MRPIADESLLSLLGLFGLLIGAAGYLWAALALSAMFRKMGDEPWKGWVPFLNLATVLTWGGFNPWLVLIGLIPFAGPIAIAILVIISAHRINPGFGYGTAMTVLAAFLFVVWASILGFGPARWLGARAAAWRRAAVDPVAPALASPTKAAPLAVAPPVLSAHVEASPDAFAPPPPRVASAWVWVPPDITTSQPAEAELAAAPSPAASAPAPAREAPAEISWPSEIDDVSAVSPSPFPPSAAAGRRGAAPLVPEDAEDAQDAEDAEDEPSGPIAFVPGRRGSAVAPPVAHPVTRMPAQHSREPIGDGDDDLERTLIARRLRRPLWELVPASGVPLPLTSDVVILGRRPAADPTYPRAQLVCVQDTARTVSKTHARIELRGDRWLITDLDSTNGVLLRTLMGEELEIEPGTELQAGERFYLGDEEFLLHRVEN